MTHDHFQELYDGVAFNYSVYRSQRLSTIRQFVLSDSVELLIMTIDSFNKDTNIINNYSDRLAGAKPINLIRSVRPILILDEPQNMESEKARLAIRSLYPLFTLRYSATHKHYYNLLYRLTPFDAYRSGLVKQIEVYSITEDTEIDQAYLRLENVFRKNGSFFADIQVNALDKHGNIKKKNITVKPDDSIYPKTRLPYYKNWTVSTINLREREVRFKKGQRLKVGGYHGSDRHKIMEKQIELCISEHLRRSEDLRAFGIKVLSLFFIDRVNNYRDPDGWIRQSFENKFDKIKQLYPYYQKMDSKIVHSGYFSKKKTEGAIENDSEAFDLIMRDKEKLLSLEEPVEFIFSHSALREGWDNPNVFNVCTLNYSVSTIKKRQEIGRGIRLCVNQNGERIFNRDINRLTVVANESYAEYVSRLQTEYEQEYGEGVPRPPIKNARKRRQIKLHPDIEKNLYFMAIRDKISLKANFRLNFDKEIFQKKCISDISKVKVHPPSLKIAKASLSADSKGFTAGEISEEKSDVIKTSAVKIFPLVEQIISETFLTRKTVIDILMKSKNLENLFVNPIGFVTKVIEIIKSNAASTISESISYYPEEEIRRFNLNQSFESFGDELVEVNKSIYPYLSFNSNREKVLIEFFESCSSIKFYIKLNPWFEIPTPNSNYRPEWAVLCANKENEQEIFVCDYLMAQQSSNKSYYLNNHSAGEYFRTLGINYLVFDSLNKFEEMINSHHFVSDMQR
jgi:type III restriction enzyme